jgi:cytochrome c-type biogenesis protein CcmE
MNVNHRYRLYKLISSLIFLGIGVYFIASAFKENINLFLTPTQAVSQLKSHQSRGLRIGGLVEKGTVHWSDDRLVVTFKLTDGKNSINVQYKGALPSLFREGQGLVVAGKFNSELVLNATTILAKHDENYRPPNLRESV